MRIRDLALAVIIQAVEDAIESDLEARDWLQSDDAKVWAEAAGIINPDPQPLPDVVTVSELVREHGVGQKTINDACLSGKLPAIKHKGRWRILEPAALEWAKEYSKK